MPNLAFQWEVLNQVIAKLQSMGDPRAAKLTANKQFAVLGAMGPDLLRYSPISSTLSDGLVALAPQLASATSQQPPPSQAQLQTLVLNAIGIPGLTELQANPVGAIYAVLFRMLVIPIWPTINSINSFLAQIEAVVQAEDTLGLIPLVSQATGLESQATALANNAAVITQITAVAGLILALPPWMEQSEVPIPAPTDPAGDRLSEFLRWHHTDQFARQLLSSASNDQETAYAIGYLSHVAASVTGEPFVNNITGGPYRTHWWRNRLVSNFIDSWVFGFFETGATMTGDNPTPAYDTWKALCTRNLEQEFNVGGLSAPTDGSLPDALTSMASGNLGSLPNALPAGFAEYLQKAVDAVYPAASRPAGFSAQAFQNAYVGAFAVYWFMTSGSGPLGVNTLGAPPVDCMTAPGWITMGSTPSPQQAGLNTSGAICGAVLAILALLELLFGDVPGGLAALAAAINAPIINWPVVNCNLFWLSKTLIDAENALQTALVTAGLAYPPPASLGVVTIDANNQPITQPAVDQSSTPLCKSNNFSGSATIAGIDAAYPRTMDATQQAADLDFQAYPTTRGEAPATMNFPNPNVYPDFVVSGAGLQNGGLMTSGAFPSRNLFLGDAVSNAVQLIQDGPGKLPSYNLDADRGYGWLTWNPQTGTTPDVPPIVAVPE